MIIFQTQEEFEDAVMNVLKERLKLSVNGWSYDSMLSEVSVKLEDCGEVFVESSTTG